MHLSSLILYALLLVHNSFSQEKPQKRLVCQLVDDKDKAPIKIDENDKDGVKVLPFSFSGAAGMIQSALPFLKNLPRVDSPEELPPLSIQGATQNLAITCDVISDNAKSEITDLKDKVSRLTKLVEKIEENSVCPGGVTYLDRCFRLMEIRGKTFSQPKAEDLCNFNGGVLAKLDNPLLFAIVTSYVLEKFNEAKYENATVLSAWTGMTYKMATTGVTLGPFSLPVLDNGTDKKLNALLNKNIVWMNGYPREIPAFNRIALQFRFAGPRRERATNLGAINAPKRRSFVPLCQFQMNDWQDEKSVSERLFRFNF